MGDDQTTRPHSDVWLNLKECPFAPKEMYSCGTIPDIVNVLNKSTASNDKIVSAWRNFSSCSSNLICSEIQIQPIKNQLLVRGYGKDTTTKNFQVFYTSTPTILPLNSREGGYLCVIRCVNYSTLESIWPVPQITYNTLALLNKELEFDRKITANSILDEEQNCAHNNIYKGIEDVRLRWKSKVNYNNNNDGHNEESSVIEFLGTISVHESFGTFLAIGYGESKFVNEDITMPVSKLYANAVKSPLDHNVEKNWCFVDCNSGRSSEVIYSWHPMVIGNIEFQNNNASTKSTSLAQFVPTREIETPFMFSHAKGSSSGFVHNDETWFIVHFSCDKNFSDENKSCVFRTYYHAFAVFDAEFTHLIRYSAPFRFGNGESIQMCTSIVVENDRIIIPYSVFDNQSFIAVYPRDYIEKLVSLYP